MRVLIAEDDLITRRLLQSKPSGEWVRVGEFCTQAGVAAPDEQNVSQPLTGLGAGGGALLVPASSWLVAYT